MTKDKTPKIQTDDIIERIVDNPNNPSVRKLSGRYLGKASDDKSWRLYINDSLSHYLEFSKEDTLDAERVASGKVIVWLKPQSEVTEVRRRRGPVEFLKGEIHAANVGKLRNPIVDAPLRTALGISAAACPTSAHVPCPPPGPDPDSTVLYTCYC